MVMGVVKGVAWYVGVALSVSEITKLRPMLKTASNSFLDIGTLYGRPNTF